MYVASAEDKNADRARLKAESQALEDLVNECSFAPKGTRIEDRYERKDGSLHQSFAKAAVEFQLCEEAKQAVEPGKIRALASAPFTEELKRYQDILNSSDANPMLADTQAPTDSASTSRVRWVVIRDEPQFWMIRQEVAVQKQVVILSPPSSYSSNSPQAQQVTTQLTSASQQIQKYEATNPHVKTASWSEYQRGRRVSRTSSFAPPARRLEEKPQRVANARKRGRRRRRF